MQTPEPQSGHLPATLSAVRAWTRSLPPPVVIFNKSHSGSRLLAELVRASGVFMGAHQNASGDSEDVLQLVEYVVCRYYPDFRFLARMEGSEEAALCGLIERILRAHRAGIEVSRWGWKLSETAYVLPLIDDLFPQARYVHLIRDGRDVAFCNHVPPFNRFWEKVYVDACDLVYARGLWFGRASKLAYRLDPLPYNVQHWINSVSVARRYGAALRERYLEIRYEELCLDFDAQAKRVLSFIGAPDAAAGIAAVRPHVSTASVGKFRRRAWWQRRRAERLARPLLTALGYLPETPRR